jgi:hypothetical protein
VIISLRLKRKKARGSQALLAKDLKKENSQIRGTPLICSQTKILSLGALPLFVIKQNEFQNYGHSSYLFSDKNSQIRGTPFVCFQIGKILKLGALPFFNLK